MPARASYRLQGRERIAFELGLIGIGVYLLVFFGAAMLVMRTDQVVLRLLCAATIAFQIIFGFAYLRNLFTVYGWRRVAGDFRSAFGRWATRVECPHCGAGSTYDASTLHVACGFCGHRQRERVRATGDADAMKRTWSGWTRSCRKCRRPVERPARIDLYCAKCHRWHAVAQPLEVRV